MTFKIFFPFNPFYMMGTLASKRLTKFLELHLVKNSRKPDKRGSGSSELKSPTSKSFKYPLD